MLCSAFKISVLDYPAEVIVPSTLLSLSRPCLCYQQFLHLCHHLSCSSLPSLKEHHSPYHLPPTFLLLPVLFQGENQLQVLPAPFCNRGLLRALEQAPSFTRMKANNNLVPTDPVQESPTDTVIAFI